MELTLKGPSLSHDWKKGDDIDVDTAFGHKVLIDLHGRGINMPVILLTTEDLEKNKWLYDDDKRLEFIIMMKNSRGNLDVYAEMEKAIKAFLGPELDFHEWVKILIVGDENETGRDVESMFKDGGFCAEYATTSHEALEKLEHGLCDLLLVDIKEGKCTGIDVVKSLRKKEKRPKIMAISDMPHDELRAVLQKEGIEHLVDGYDDKLKLSIPGRLVGSAVYRLEQYSQ